MVNLRKLLGEDFNKPCKDMAEYLLGKILVRKLDDGTLLKGRIVETECYPGGEDKASSTFNGRRTPANEPLYMPPGTAFIYMTYGMYFCFNISTPEAGGGVLLRALEPLEGLEAMGKLRSKKNKKKLKDIEFCNGPSKLCMAMNITKIECNTLDLTNNDVLWIEDDYNNDLQIVTSTRIGIANAGHEWASKPFRFYIHSNPHVSKIDVKAEESLTT